MTDNNPVLIQSKLNKNSNKNVNNEEELLKINSNNYNSNSQMLPKKNENSHLRESKNQSGIELPSQNDSKIGLLGRGPNLLNNLGQKAQIKSKLSQSDFPANNNNNSGSNNNIDKNSKNNFISNFNKKNNNSINDSSRKDEHDSFSAKSSSMSSKRSNKIGSQKIEKVKTFAEDFKYKNLKDEERNESSSSFKKQKSRKDDFNNNNIDRDLDDEEDFNYDNNMNLDKKDHRRLTKREKICDSDTEDEGSDTEKDVRWIIMPENSYKRAWDIIIALIILYSSIMLPYEIAFVDDDNAIQESPIDIIFNILLGIDIILNFFSAYLDNEENVVKNRRMIIVSYLKLWFWIDFASVFPVTEILSSVNAQELAELQSQGGRGSKNYNALVRLTKIPKLYRMLKNTKFFRMIKTLKKGNVNKITKFFLEKLKVNANIERLFFFILAFLLLNHLAACIWYYIAKLQDLSPDCWVTRLGYIDASESEIYIVSFYWTLTTVTTVGYGDVNAGTTVERIYNLFIMSFGVLMYSFTIGSLSSIVSTLDAKTAEMNQKLQILASIKKEFALDQEIYDKVRKVIKYDLSRNQKDKMNFLQELPNKLRIELSQIMHDDVIKKMYFFKDQPSDFIAYVAPLLKPVKFSQNDHLYKVGDMIDEMYFISKGTVSFCLGKDQGEKEIKEFKKHNNFGEIEMCLNEKLSYNIKVKSRNCELFVLKKNDFLRLSVNFKEFIEKFLQKSLMKYLRFNEEKKKILKSIDDKNNSIGGLRNANSQSKIGKNDDLEQINEEKEEEVSEEYDVYASHSDSEHENKESSEGEDINEKKDSFAEEEEDENKSSDSDNNENENVNSNTRKALNNINSGNNTGSNNINTNNNINNANNNAGSGNEEDSNESGADDGKKGIILKNLMNKKKSGENLGGPANNKNSSKENSELSEGEEQADENPENVEKLKTQMNKKFIKKVDKIIEFLEKNKVELDGKSEDGNALMLLKKLKNIDDLLERNEVIDKIENIVSEIFNRAEKK